MEKMNSLLKEKWNMRIYLKDKNCTDKNLDPVVNEILDLLIRRGFSPTQIITSNKNE